MARICMVAYTHYPTDSRVRREAEALVERGDAVDVICLGVQGERNPEIYHGVRMIKIIVKRYRGASASMYILSYLHFFIATTFKLVYLHLKNAYQVIQVHTMPDFMVFVAIFPKILGAKVLLDVHDLMPELYQSKFGFLATHPVIRFVTWVERLSIGFADQAMAVHRPHLDALCRHGNSPQKFLILLNLPDTKVFKAGQGNQSAGCDAKFELMYHGMLAERNGLEIAVRAVAALRDEIAGIRLNIIGDGDAIPHLLDLIAQLDLTSIVKLDVGMIPMENLIPRILGADVGIVPILYDDFTKYMLPVKLLEYIALEKPVICSRTETIQAYFDETQVQFCAPGSVTELIESIRLLYHEPERRKKLSKNASTFNLVFNWDEQKKSYYDLIDDLIQK